MVRGTKVKCSVKRRTEGRTALNHKRVCVCVCVCVLGGRGESAEIIIDWTLFTSHFSIIAVKAKVSL